MKRRLGISIYPEQSSFEEDKQYLERAKEYGFEVLFTSVLHFANDEEFNNKAQKVLRSLKYAKSLGFYTILDVEYKSMRLLNLQMDNLGKCKQYGIDCLRLDSPSLPFEIATVTHNNEHIDIQLNMSNNDHLIDNVLDFQPVKSRISGCHNFYPMKFTGLPFEFFKKANKKFLKHGLETAAFVGSHFGKMTTAFDCKELPTLEEQRDLSIKEQAKILFYSNQIDTVLIGNAYASEEELKELSSLERYEITFDLKILTNISEVEKGVLNFEHFRRGDINEYFIRSTFSRVKYKDSSIEPNNLNKLYTYGDVVIVNNNDKKYKGELHIILKDNLEDTENKYNYIGRIKESEFRLFDFIKPWSHFRFSSEEL